MKKIKLIFTTLLLIIFSMVTFSNVAISVKKIDFDNEKEYIDEVDDNKIDWTKKFNKIIPSHDVIGLGEGDALTNFTVSWRDWMNYEYSEDRPSIGYHYFDHRIGINSNYFNDPNFVYSTMTYQLVSWAFDSDIHYYIGDDRWKLFNKFVSNNFEIFFASTDSNELYEDILRWEDDIHHESGSTNFTPGMFFWSAMEPEEYYKKMIDLPSLEENGEYLFYELSVDEVVNIIHDQPRQIPSNPNIDDYYPWGMFIDLPNLFFGVKAREDSIFTGWYLTNIGIRNMDYNTFAEWLIDLDILENEMEIFREFIHATSYRHIDSIWGMDISDFEYVWTNGNDRHNWWWEDDYMNLSTYFYYLMLGYIDFFHNPADLFMGLYPMNNDFLELNDVATIRVYDRERNDISDWHTFPEDYFVFEMETGTMWPGVFTRPGEITMVFDKAEWQGWPETMPNIDLPIDHKPEPIIPPIPPTGGDNGSFSNISPWLLIIFIITGALILLSIIWAMYRFIFKIFILSKLKDNDK